MKKIWKTKLVPEALKIYQNLSKSEKAKIIWIIDLLKESGVSLKEPFAKHIKDKIWELRPTEQIRLFYLLEDDTFTILHILKKKSWKIPEKEIKKVVKRKEKYFGKEQ